MKRLLIAVSALSLLAGGSAMAQSRGDFRHDYRGGEAQRFNGGRDGWRGDYGYRGGYGYRGDYGRGWSGGYGYRAPVYGYARPYGYGGGWRVGGYLPRTYFAPRYYVNDWAYYGLRAPPYGYRYYRAGDDFVLAAIAGGLIAGVFSGY